MAEPTFNMADPRFSVKSDLVRDARDSDWYATTNYGLAILRYAEVNKLMKHPKLRQGSVAWPAHNGVTTGPFADWWASWILNKEGEDHRRLRRLLNPAFSPKLLASLAPRFADLGNELIDGFAERGEVEFVSEFAEPYAARVIAIMLGIPESEWKTIASLSTTIGLAMGVTLREDLPQIEEALLGLYEYGDQLIADRSANPQDDFVTRLVQAQRDEDSLSELELRQTLALLVFGGFDTTRNQLGLAIQTFIEHPDQWKLLADNPDLGGAAVEEVMRVNPTVTWVTREALEDFTFQDLEIKAGTTLHLFSESAGTDPRAVDGGFDITAERPPHFGFGGGAHHCLGHFVARSDMNLALPLLAQRMPNVAFGGPSEWLPLSGNTGPNVLPLSFDPAATA